MLHEFIALNRDEIIRRCRVKVATRPVPPHTDTEIDHGVPLFLDQLVDALRQGKASSPEISRSAVLHGHDLLLQGFTVSQVVHDYGDVCQSITDLAVETDASISTQDFRLLNGCLDDAIAGAVTQYGRDRDETSTEEGIARKNERLGFFAHELRDLIHTALIAFDVVKSGRVGVAGSTGAVLHRSLVSARDLMARSLADVLHTQGLQNREPFPVSGLLEELAPVAALEAHTRGLHFTVVPVEDGVAVNADRQVLATAVMNILQNAFKFTKPRTTVTLRVLATADRVLLEIQDECGGLPTGDVNALFRPFEPRSADRTGLGLAFSRWAIEANDGRILARSLPDVGCVFAIELPRAPMPVMAI
jgi:signal transduction histidine kinase